MDTNRIICIGRQLGSGGSVVARLLAQRFGCKLYDRELLNLAARESGFSEKFFEQNDEHKGFFRSLFHPMGRAFSTDGFYGQEFSEERLFQIQSDVIRRAAEQGDCVFVGRCADYVLRDHPGMISIFVTADLSERIGRVATRRQCSHEEARRFILKMESHRAAYYNYYTGKQWGHAAAYHLCVSTTPHRIEQTAELIADFIQPSSVNR